MSPLAQRLATLLIVVESLSSPDIGWAAESYTKIDRGDLNFGFAAAIKSYVVDSDRKVTRIEGVVKEFSLAGKGIDLETNRLVMDGGSIFILTKDFGRVRVTWDLLGMEEIWLTPSQKKQFEIFLAQAATSVSGERVLTHKSCVFALAFSPDGLTVATGTEDDDGRIKLWDSASGRLEARLPALKTVVALAFSPDGKALASGQSGEPSVRLWDTSKAMELTALSEGDFGNVFPSIQCVTYGPRASLLATEGPKNTVYIWDPMERRSVYALNGHPSKLTALAFRSDGTMLASASCGAGKTIYDPGVLKLWDLRTGKQLAELKGHTSYIAALAFTANGETLVSAGYTQSHKGEIHFWNVASGRQVRDFKGIVNNVDEVTLSLDGRTLATSGDGPAVRVWDVPQGTLLRELKCRTGRVTSMAFSPNSRLLATGSAEGTVRVWDLTNR